MSTHFTWSIERSEHCPKCLGEVVLVVSKGGWFIYDSKGEATDDEAEIDEEVTGHWCPECLLLTSLSLNT